MRRFALAVLLVACLPAQAGQEQRLNRELHGIKGGDDRVAVAAEQYPWSAMGRLNNGLGGHCSGVLIGPKLLATAAHCLWNPRTQGVIPVTSLTFVAGYDRGAYLKASKVTRLHPSPAWSFSATPGGLASRVNDWALLELEESLGDEVGYVALGSDPEQGQAVTAAGYGKDKAHVPTAHLGCHVLERRGGLFVNDCDAVQGDSGGPMLIWQGGQPRVAALNVAVLIGAGDLGVAVGVSAFKAEAAKLGAMAMSKAGSVSKPLDGVIKAKAEAR
ncbi:MAG: trypsin-like serine protease [Rhodospirillaceae bacterium]|nr:trypsin-like serine protease [Rhodospirillales bacterium]